MVLKDLADVTSVPMTQSGKNGPRLLLVEDDPELAGMLEELLVQEGYQVEVARDGQRGLHLGLTHPFDLMILDRGLPAIDGLDLLGRLRSSGYLGPVLILSALGLPRDRVEGLDAGAEDYLGKPFDVDELLARLRALAGGMSREPTPCSCRGHSCRSAPAWSRWPPEPPSTSPTESAHCWSCSRAGADACSPGQS